MSCVVISDQQQMFEFFDEVNKIHATGDKRQMVLLIGLYGEYVVNEILRTNFVKSELDELNSQDVKLKILRATNLLSPDEYSVLKTLNEVRNKYAHNLKVDEKKMEDKMRGIRINWVADDKKIKELEKQFNKIPFTKFQSGCIAKIIFLFQKLWGFLPKRNPVKIIGTKSVKKVNPN